MTIKEIQNELWALQDAKYREFQLKLLPTVDAQTIIGTRTPQLRSFAKRLVRAGDVDEFLCTLPHQFFDENQLHAFILSEIEDFPRCLQLVKSFLPYIDNWATCDQLSPAVFKNNKPELLQAVKTWLQSDHVYTVRFAVGMLMQYFLDEDFDVQFAEMVANVKHTDYYVQMMVAWYFATALAKQYQIVLPFIEAKRLDVWTHNKTIQKAVESRRLTATQKEHLKSLRIKKKKAKK